MLVVEVVVEDVAVLVIEVDFDDCEAPSAGAGVSWLAVEARRLSWTLELTDRGEMMAEIWLEFLFLLVAAWLMTDWCLCLLFGGDTRAAREMVLYSDGSSDSGRVSISGLTSVSVLVSRTVTSSTSSSLSLMSTAISVSSVSCLVSTVNTEVAPVAGMEVVMEDWAVLTTAG